LTMKRAHYPYWGTLRSLLLGGPVWVDVWDGTVFDVDGREVLHVDHARGQMYVGEVVWSQAWSLVGRPDLELHFGECHVDRGRARSGRDSAGKVNLPHAFTGKAPHASRGGMRVRLESATVDDASYAMAMPGWHGEVEHARGTGHLYASTFAEEQAPHQVAFRV